MRGETTYTNPEPELTLEAGDNLAVLGTKEQRDLVRRLSEAAQSIGVLSP